MDPWPQHICLSHARAVVRHIPELRLMQDQVPAWPQASLQSLGNHFYDQGAKEVGWLAPLLPHQWQIHPQTRPFDIQPMPRQALPSSESSPREAAHQLRVTRVPGKRSATAVLILLVNLGLSWEIIKASYSPVILRFLWFQYSLDLD